MLWFGLFAMVIATCFILTLRGKDDRAKSDAASAELDAIIGPISPELVLGAAIPLKEGSRLGGPYAQSLARHFKLYLKHNPEEAARYLHLTDGDMSPEEVLDHEMMLEHDQYLRALICRAVLHIKQKGNWEFCSAIDQTRLESLVSAQERRPGAFFLDGAANNTVNQSRWDRSIRA